MKKAISKKKKVQKKAVVITQAHVHHFRKSGLNLYCVCGDVRQLTCGHEWVLEKSTPITFDVMGGKVSQTENVYNCKGCGAIRHTNPIAGTTRIVTTP